MSDEQAYMELVLCNTQSELHPLEEGKHAAEKPALNDVSGAGNVNQNAFLVHISPADLPRNERQIRPLIENLEHNGERLKVWSDVVATGEKPAQRALQQSADISILLDTEKRPAKSRRNVHCNTPAVCLNP